eukprot:6178662-Pleurochrysis_carterae.AAC.2
MSLATPAAAPAAIAGRTGARVSCAVQAYARSRLTRLSPTRPLPPSHLFVCRPAVAEDPLKLFDERFQLVERLQLFKFFRDPFQLSANFCPPLSAAQDNKGQVDPRKVNVLRLWNREQPGNIESVLQGLRKEFMAPAEKKKQQPADGQTYF